MTEKSNIAWQRTYKNNVTTGNTTIIIKKLKNYYRIYDHCVEGLSPDGTGINKKTRDYKYALQIAQMYGETLVAGKTLDIRATHLGVDISYNGKTLWINDENHCLVRISGIETITIKDDRGPDSVAREQEEVPSAKPPEPVPTTSVGMAQRQRDIHKCECGHPVEVHDSKGRCLGHLNQPGDTCSCNGYRPKNKCCSTCGTACRAIHPRPIDVVCGDWTPRSVRLSCPDECRICHGRGVIWDKDAYGRRRSRPCPKAGTWNQGPEPVGGVRVNPSPPSVPDQQRDSHDSIKGYLIPGIGILVHAGDLTPEIEADIKKAIDEMKSETYLVCPHCHKKDVRLHPNRDGTLVCFSCGTGYKPLRR
jgi:hypothetical protein